METQLSRNSLSFSFPGPTTYTFPPVSHLPPSSTWTSSNTSSTHISTNPPAASTDPSPGVTVNQDQQNHPGFEDAPFVNIPGDSLHDDHSDPYVPSEGDVESDDSEQAGQISNSELANNLPRVTAKKKERRAAAQAKQVVGTGKRKRTSNKARLAPAKRRNTEPSPEVVPTVDRQQADNLFASTRQKIKSRSSIYLFFTEIHENRQQHCKDWKEGDKLYQCIHSDGKVQRITPAMRGSINGLKSQLRRDAPLMYNLFEILEKKREFGSKPTPEELLVASGQRTVDHLPYKLQEQLKQIGDLSASGLVSGSKFRRIIDTANETVMGLKTMISELDRDVNELSSNECTRECDSFVTSTRAREYSFPRVHASTSFHFGTREYSRYSRGHVIIFRVGKDILYYTQKSLLSAHASVSRLASFRHTVIDSASWLSLVVGHRSAFLEFMQLEAASANLRRVVVVVVCRWLCTWLGLSEIPQPIETGNHRAGVEKVTSHSFPRSTSKTTTTTNPANAYPVPNTTTTACHSHPNDNYNTAGRGSNNDEDDTPAAATTTTTTHRRQFNHNGNDSKAGSCDRHQRRATTRRQGNLKRRRRRDRQQQRRSDNTTGGGSDLDAMAGGTLGQGDYNL
ncbi:hypothetical protein EDB89DRAFT_1908839 [Lactarius sanguifluus]|nr:hypothetical protein EDB89DRAFT_1908839 [Lactarius sanguifluus]